MTTFAHIQLIIAEELGLDVDQVAMGSDLVQLGADSLAVIQIAMRIEEWVDEEISDDQMDSLKTVGDAVRLVDDHLNAREPA